MLNVEYSPPLQGGEYSAAFLSIANSFAPSKIAATAVDEPVQARLISASAANGKAVKIPLRK